MMKISNKKSHIILQKLISEIVCFACIGISLFIFYLYEGMYNHGSNICYIHDPLYLINIKF